MSDKNWVFRRASDLGLTMQELGRRGAAKRHRKPKCMKNLERCHKCGGIVSRGQCLNCGF